MKPKQNSGTIFSSSDNLQLVPLGDAVLRQLGHCRLQLLYAARLHLPAVSDVVLLTQFLNLLLDQCVELHSVLPDLAAVARRKAEHEGRPRHIHIACRRRSNIYVRRANNNNDKIISRWRQTKWRIKTWLVLLP